MRERLVDEVADRELDGGVVAVIGVGDEGRDRAVGREAWWRQSGNSSAWAPIRRVRRTISLKPFSSVSATCASPPSG